MTASTTSKAVTMELSSSSNTAHSKCNNENVNPSGNEVQKVYRRSYRRRTLAPFGSNSAGSPSHCKLSNVNLLSTTNMETDSTPLKQTVHPNSVFSMSSLSSDLVTPSSDNYEQTILYNNSNSPTPSNNYKNSNYEQSNESSSDLNSLCKDMTSKIQIKPSVHANTGIRRSQRIRKRKQNHCEDEQESIMASSSSSVTSYSLSESTTSSKGRSKTKCRNNNKKNKTKSSAPKQESISEGLLVDRTNSGKSGAMEYDSDNAGCVKASNATKQKEEINFNQPSIVFEDSDNGSERIMNRAMARRRSLRLKSTHVGNENNHDKSEVEPNLEMQQHNHPKYKEESIIARNESRNVVVGFESKESDEHEIPGSRFKRSRRKSVLPERFRHDNTVLYSKTLIRRETCSKSPQPNNDKNDHDIFLPKAESQKHCAGEDEGESDINTQSHESRNGNRPNFEAFKNEDVNTNQKLHNSGNANNVKGKTRQDEEVKGPHDAEQDMQPNENEIVFNLETEAKQNVTVMVEQQIAVKKKRRRRSSISLHIGGLVSLKEMEKISQEVVARKRNKDFQKVDYERNMDHKMTPHHESVTETRRTVEKTDIDVKLVHGERYEVTSISHNCMETKSQVVLEQDTKNLTSIRVDDSNSGIINDRQSSCQGNSYNIVLSPEKLKDTMLDLFHDEMILSKVSISSF